MRKASLKKIVKRLLQVVLLVAIGVMFSLYLKNNWEQIRTYSFTFNPWLLGLSFCGFLLQELSYGLIWRSVLARLGSHISLRASLRIYLASEFVRYIPGNVWHVLTRILWVGKYGVSRPVALTSMVVELTTKLAAGALVFAISLLFWADDRVINTLISNPAVKIQANLTPVVVSLGILAILASLAILHPRILTTFLNLGLRLLKRDPVSLQLRYLDILLVTAYWCISWTIAGAAFYAMLLALWPAAPLIALPVCIGVYALAWDIGFLSFITPSGLGFREATIGAIMSLVMPMPAGLAGIIAVLSRFVSTIAELVCVGLAYASGGRQMREVQEQAAHVEEHVDRAEEDITEIKKAPAEVGVEGGAGK